MHIITVSVTVSLFKIQRLMILKKGLLTELEKKKDSHFLGRACFGWVGRSTENQQILRSA